ncbi:MAG: RNA polymerase sporulation sigma factor SigE [Firmicutes bacterium]|nr:RNA polymerase sporulation sigma factor SigE [Bacillota bacterium]
MTPRVALNRLILFLRLYLILLVRRLGLFPGYIILFVGNSEALPPPLSSDEEISLLKRLARGEKAVKGELIERNLRLVVYIAKKFENTGVGIEDLVSIGTIGLIKAVNTFDPMKKIKLATYASRCIENEILMYLRRNNKTRAEVSFDEPLNIDWDGNELLLSDVMGTDNDIVYKSIEEELDKSLLEAAMRRLTGREKKIMELRFGLVDGVEKTQKEVADLLGISQSYISRLEKRIIRKLRKEIKRAE